MIKRVIIIICIVVTVRMFVLAEDINEKFDISKHIYLVLEIPKQKITVNEKIPITLKLYSDWLDLENITLWEASSEYLIIEKFGDREVNIVKRNGTKYVVLGYTTTIFAVIPGEFTLNPIKVSFEIARPKKNISPEELLNNNKDLYDAFLGAADSRRAELETNPVKFIVSPPPPKAPIAVRTEDVVRKPEEKVEIEREIVGLKNSPGKLRKYNVHFYKNKIFVLIELFPFLFIIGGYVMHRRVRILQDNPVYAAWFYASRRARRGIIKAENFIKKDNTKEFYKSIIEILQEYLGKRLFQPSEGITEGIAEELKSRNIEQEILEKLKEVFSDCYLARYTSVKSGKDQMKEILDKLKYVIKNLDDKREL